MTATPLLRDAAAAKHLDRWGFALLGQLVEPSGLELLRRVFVEVVDALDGDVGEAWFATGLLPDPQLRSSVSLRCRAVVEAALAPVAFLDLSEIARIDLSIKPSSPNSALGAHQDYSVIDERFDRSRYFWIPLVDVDERNGTMEVMPGSHRFGPEVRSRFVPADLGPIADVAVARSVPLPMSAGDGLVIDAALIHHTRPNLSGSTRVAVHGILRPRSAPLVFWFCDSEQPCGEVEGYEMTMDEYLEATQQGRPARSPDVRRGRPGHSFVADELVDLMGAYRRVHGDLL